MSRPEEGGEAPTFSAPWEAQAFAMAMSLRDAGLFTWSEWADALGVALADAPEAPYYEAWLAALEALVAAKGVASPAALAARRDAWDRAAHATPHGAPIRLANDPLGHG